MTLVDEAWIKKVQAAHKKYGIKCSYRNRGGKQYLTISYDPDTTKTKIRGRRGDDLRDNHHAAVHRHVNALFPTGRITSGGFGWPSFNITIRLRAQTTNTPSV